MDAFLVCAAVAGLLLVFLNVSRRAKPGSSPLPGPTPLPVIGNLLDIPNKKPWIKFGEWSTRYGPVFSYRVLHKRVVVLNSPEAIDALTVKKGARYSNRPDMTMLKKWGGWTWSLVGLNGPEMIMHRRIMSSGLSAKACREYEPVLQRSALLLAKRVIRDLPGGETGDWRRWCRLMTAGNILNFSYGYKVLENKDPWIARAERILELIQDLGPLGTHPVDVFPILANLPQRTFGSRLATNLAELRKLLVEVHEDPYQWTKHEAEAGKERGSFVSRMLQMLDSEADSGSFIQDKPLEDVIDVIKGTAATMYTVGVETVESSLNTFVLAMVLNPEVQAWAQEQIDHHLKENLREHDIPTLEDRSSASLPAVEALVWEVLRWEPATPLAIARETFTDDVYQGMLIPKGSIILTNSWQCLHDSSLYPEPLTFNPKRFLSKDHKLDTNKPLQPDPRDFAFGYGRRVCPGRIFAESTLWITITTMLTLFTFEKARDDFGIEIEPLISYENGAAVQFPRPFRMSVKLRDGAEEKLHKALSRLDH